MSYALLHGDCIETMRGLPAGSVQTCITSPPYFGLRSYLPDGHDDKHMEIGTEETPEQFVGKLVEVFREVKRVLRDDGTLWLNLGDSYNGSGGYYPDSPSNRAGSLSSRQDQGSGAKTQGATRVAGLKPKDLIGIPWMVAFALRADGWYLRSEIIWHKKAPMPESVTDRPTKAHEQLFLLSKSQKYFYDADAIREPHQGDSGWAKQRANGVDTTKYSPDDALYGARRRHEGERGMEEHPNGRNKRSVWTLGPESFAGSHYATMPSKLVEPCVLAGTSAHGCCAKCGAPWVRETERIREHGLAETSFPKTDGLERQNGHKRLHQRIKAARAAGEPHDNPLGGAVTIGWQPTCTCAADVVPCTVLDPFFGSGTTAAVALKHGRNFIGIDIDERNIELAHERIRRSQPMLLEVT